MLPLAAFLLRLSSKLDSGRMRFLGRLIHQAKHFLMKNTKTFQSMNTNSVFLQTLLSHLWLMITLVMVGMVVSDFLTFCIPQFLNLCVFSCIASYSVIMDEHVVLGPSTFASGFQFAQEQFTTCSCSCYLDCSSLYRSCCVAENECGQCLPGFTWNNSNGICEKIGK